LPGVLGRKGYGGLLLQALITGLLRAAPGAVHQLKSERIKMTGKGLLWYEAAYLKALAYAVVYGTGLTVEQFAAAHALEADELEQLREHMERQGFGI
jgi:hypothetical protein